jgi:hypothetical protein
MKTKEIIQSKLERVEAKVKKVGYHIRKAEYEIAYDTIEKVLDETADIQTYLNRETQD